MSAINLTELRERTQPPVVLLHIHDDERCAQCTLCALIDTAEAAMEYQRQHWTHNESTSQRRLRESLAPYTTSAQT